MSNNQTLKRRVYERSGDSEYWIVEPAGPPVLQLLLRDGNYVELPSTEDIKVAIPPQVQIALSEVW